MKNWDYLELIEAVTENFNSFVKIGSTIGEAIERCFYEFESAVNDGLCERVIIHSTIIMQLPEKSRISKRQFDKLYESVKSYESSKVFHEINNNEAELLNSQVKAATKKILEMKSFT